MTELNPRIFNLFMRSFEKRALNKRRRVLIPSAKGNVLPHHKHNKNLANNLNGEWKKVGRCNINRDALRNNENINFRVENYERFGNDCFVFIKGVGMKR